MTKVQKLLKALKEVAKRPSLINLLINNDLVWNDHLQKKFSSLTKLPVVSLEDIVPENNYNLQLYSYLGGGSLPTDIILLKSLCARIKDCSYFEIGTWRGESVRNVSEIAKECYTLDLPEETLRSLGKDRNYLNQRGLFSKNIDNITHVTGDSSNFDFKGIQKKFDIIFIDGSHRYADVKNDTLNVFKHLMHEKSLVIWHDYAYDPESVRPEVLAGILEGVPEKFHGNLYHVSHTKCALFSPEKMQHTETLLQNPKTVFQVQLIPVTPSI